MLMCSESVILFLDVEPKEIVFLGRHQTEILTELLAVLEKLEIIQFSGFQDCMLESPEDLLKISKLW